MWRVIVLSFFGGVLGGNGLPHFVRGITRQTYPTVFGNGPVINLLAGWAGLTLSGVLFLLARPGQHPAWAFAFAALGVLPVGLFHAGPGAFPRPDAPARAGEGAAEDAGQRFG
jgi:hypothetical protein